MKKQICILVIFLVPGIVYAGATASAFKRDNRRGANFWNAQAAIDSNPETAWMVPGDSPNRGEWILIELPRGEVDSISILPGWGRDQTTFDDYARVRKLGIEVLCCLDDTPMASIYTGEIELADRNEIQIVDLENIQVGNELFGGRIRLTVTETYSGRDYPNLAVSEVLVRLTEFDVPSAKVEEASTASEGHVADSMIDGNARSFWATAEEAPSFEVEASGFGLSSIGIQAGPRTHARPQRVRLSANGRQAEYTVEDNNTLQWFEVAPLTGYTGSAWGNVMVEILETYEGSQSTEVAVSEVKARATNYEGL